jgi:hypothetical protein
LGTAIVGLAAFTAIAARDATAAPSSPSTSRFDLPPGGGLGAVTIDLDLDPGKRSMSLAGCATCTATIALADPLDKPSMETIAVGNGRVVGHVVVRSTSRPSIAWEALVSGTTKKSPQILWSGATGLDAAGEGAGGRVTIEGKQIFVGELRRELTICGQPETLLAPKRLDPASMTLHFVAMPRLSSAVRSLATKMTATPTTDAPIGSVLGVRGASTNDGGSAALVDEDPATAWIEAKKGDGRGEFVVFNAPRSLPIAKLSFVVQPTKPVENFSQPSSIFVSVDGATYAVELPEEKTPGARVEVVFPKPIVTSCLAVSLDRAYMQNEADSAVGFAEIEAVPVVPATVHSIDDLITLLDAGEGDAVLAMSLLEHAGARGAKAIAAKIAAMGDVGKERSVEVLEAAPCPAAGPALVRLSWDAPKSTTAAARVALDACGAEAKGAIAEAFATGGAAVKELVAERYAKLDPRGALDAILAVVPTSSAARRRTFRQAIARVVSSSEGKQAILDWLGKHAGDAPGAGVDATIELGRALVGSDDLPAVAAPLSKAILARATNDFTRRWLAAEPLAALATKGDQAALAWIRALFGDPDRYLRARATSVAASIDALRPELFHALLDHDPRVRQEALGALRRGSVPGAAVPAKTLLKTDAWTFVRVAAAELLGDVGSAGGGPDIDVSLADATKDEARSVRIAALAALAHRNARSQIVAVRARAFDEEESVEVRREAVAALGALCDVASADALFELAKRTGESDAARTLALTAIVALGAIHPPDLAARLKALDAKELVVKDAIARALKTPPMCGATP